MEGESATRQEKRIRDRGIRKEEVKLSVYADDGIISGNFKRINENILKSCSKIAGIKSEINKPYI